ncbi:phage scaffolding protein [Companilactobacillus allii]|uniref:Phage capsid protein n=1 Tax=Companilactobacillus allii TaxID=1847728 RepID=A0A1P8Q4B6_9LACO|nr:phage scaffolding protein [Companilactobacillus allii]APX72708.1 phage capsid protein [Companilactobacillus allii]USQ69815.1 phage scaffolding protein [Companilactobacillus allii]
MKREFLKELSLDDKVIDKIMSANGADIENTKKSLGDVDSIKQENESLKIQLTERDKDMKALKKQAGDNEKLSNKYTELQGKYKTDTENLNAQLSITKLNGALDSALNSAKVRNPKAIRGLLNMDNIKLNDQGELVGVSDQLDSLKKSDGYLFDEGNGQRYEPKGGSGSDDKNTVQDLVNVFKK